MSLWTECNLKVVTREAGNLYTRGVHKVWGRPQYVLGLDTEYGLDIGHMIADAEAVTDADTDADAYTLRRRRRRCTIETGLRV